MRIVLASLGALLWTSPGFAEVEAVEVADANAFVMPVEASPTEDGVQSSRSEKRRPRAFVEAEPLYAVGGCSACRAGQPGIEVALGWVPAPWIDFGFSYLHVTNPAGNEPNGAAWSYWAVRGAFHATSSGLFDPRIGFKLGGTSGLQRAGDAQTNEEPRAPSGTRPQAAASLLLGLDLRCADYLRTGVEFERLFPFAGGPSPIVAGVRLGLEF